MIVYVEEILCGESRTPLYFITCNCEEWYLSRDGKKIDSNILPTISLSTYENDITAFKSFREAMQILHRHFRVYSTSALFKFKVKERK